MTPKIEWKSFSTKEQNIMFLDTPPSLKVGDQNISKCDFWKTLNFNWLNPE